MMQNHLHLTDCSPRLLLPSWLKLAAPWFQFAKFLLRTNSNNISKSHINEFLFPSWWRVSKLTSSLRAATSLSYLILSYLILSFSLSYPILSLSLSFKVDLLSKGGHLFRHHLSHLLPHGSHLSQIWQDIFWMLQEMIYYWFALVFFR